MRSGAVASLRKRSETGIRGLTWQAKAIEWHGTC